MPSIMTALLRRADPASSAPPMMPPTLPPGAVVPAMPPPPGIVPNFENPDSRGDEIVNVYAVFLSIAFVFIVLRMYTRVAITRAVGLDDYAMIAAFICSAAFTAINLMLVKYGFGVHMWDLPLWKFSPHFLYYANIGSVMHGLTMIFAKASVLLLYHRIFQPNRKTAWAIYATLALVLAYNIAIIFSVIFACSPRRKVFDVTITWGKCINVLALAVVGGTLNAFTDIIILLLPMPIVWHLRLPLKQKIAVAAIFATGAFVCAVSIFRLAVISENFRDPDVTVSQVPNTIWSAIEVNVGIACGCMPTLKQFFRQHIPKFLSFTSRGSRGGSSKGKVSGGGGGGPHSDDDRMAGSGSAGGASSDLSWTSKREKHHRSVGASTIAADDPRLVNGRYLELGEMGTNETVIGSRLSPDLSAMATRTTPITTTTTMAGNGTTTRAALSKPLPGGGMDRGRGVGGIVKTVGVDVYEKPR